MPHTKRLRVILSLLAVSSLAALAQDAPPVTFQSKVNLVLVPVVVRDAHRRPVGNLTRDDFQLFDKRKLQTISSFSVIKRAGGTLEDKAATTARTADAGPPVVAAPNKNPERYVIYLFDDLNTTFADLVPVRVAAARHMKHSLGPTDRAAIYTVSGRPTLEFTGDRTKLEDSVNGLRVRQTFGHDPMQCPGVTYYLADLIINRDDEHALLGLIQHTVACLHVNGDTAKLIVLSDARRELFIGEQETQMVLRTLRHAIRRLAAMPGQRLIVLASPGFYMQTSDSTREKAELLDQAAKANVMISAVDPRGVYTNEAEASDRGAPSRLWLQYRRMSMEANNDVLTELTESTGGTFFHNNNDLNVGFDRVAAAPEVTYVLGFSPTALKANGSFHSLKVRLPNEKGLSIEARRGYYALKRKPEEQAARSEIDDAVFSRDEMSDIPVVLETGFYKPDVGDPKVVLVVKVDVKWLHFHKAEGRSRDSLTVVSALFDSEGGYVTGTTKTVNLRLRDETLAHMDSGIAWKSEFDAKSGRYLVRLVVREAEGKAMTTRNGTVTIP